MRGLIIKSPYIEDILNGKKDWEVRGVNTKIRGAVALIKAGSGLILGYVDISAVKRLNEGDYANWNYHNLHGKFKSNNLPYKKTYAWVLSNPRWLDEPISYKHPRGAVIWVNLDSLDISKKINMVK